MRHRRWPAGPLVLALAAGSAFSVEPDGLFALRSEWDDPDHLRVTIQALVPLEDVVITWVGPQGLSLKAERDEGEKAPEPLAGGERLALGDLPGQGVQPLRLRVEGVRGSGAGRIAMVKVEGMFRGRLVREAIGIPVGEGRPGRPRGDVLEYDAAVEPHP